MPQANTGSFQVCYPSRRQDLSRLWTSRHTHCDLLQSLSTQGCWPHLSRFQHSESQRSRKPLPRLSEKEANSCSVKKRLTRSWCSGSNRLTWCRERCACCWLSLLYGPEVEYGFRIVMIFRASGLVFHTGWQSSLELQARRPGVSSCFLDRSRYEDVMSSPPEHVQSVSIVSDSSSSF